MRNCACIEISPPIFSWSVNSSLCLRNPGDVEREVQVGVVPISQAKIVAEGGFPPRFCALAYVSMSSKSRIPAAKRIILLVTQEASGAWKLLVNKNLTKIVDALDLPYIESLVEDFVERIRLYAADLFGQLCSLTVGPLQVETVGERLWKYPGIHQLALQFAER